MLGSSYNEEYRVNTVPGVPRQKEKGVAEKEMVRWHHQLNGHAFEQTLEEGGGQRSLECYRLYVTESGRTWHLNNSDTRWPQSVYKETGRDT